MGSTEGEADVEAYGWDLGDVRRYWVVIGRGCLTSANAMNMSSSLPCR